LARKNGNPFAVVGGGGSYLSGNNTKGKERKVNI